MNNLEENDFGLLLFANLSKNKIKTVNKPFLQKLLYDFVDHPSYEVLFKNLFVQRDEFGENTGYVDLTSAFNAACRNAIILADIDETKKSVVYRILTDDKTDKITMYVNKKYGSYYSLLMDKMTDYLVLKGFNYCDSEYLNDKTTKKLELHELKK